MSRTRQLKRHPRKRHSSWPQRLGPDIQICASSNARPTAARAVREAPVEDARPGPRGERTGAENMAVCPNEMVPLQIDLA
jgi:hypothetical protein